MEKDLYKVEISGLTCTNCATKVEKNLKTITDLEQVSVNFANRTAYFHARSSDILPLVKSKIEELGYHMKNVQTPDQLLSEFQLEQKEQMRQFVLSLICGAVLMAMSMTNINSIYQLLIILPLVYYTGRPFFIGIQNFLLGKGSDMNTLVGLGVASAIIFSAVISLFPEQALTWGFQNHVYYETAAFIIGFIRLGKFLEDRARFQTRKALMDLMSLQAKVAFIFRDGQFVETPISEIKNGDRVLVKAHERCAVDGKIVKGISTVDESMMTGESIPSRKQPDDLVIAGSMNLEGSLEIIATKVGSETFLSQIIQLVEQAQGSKPAIQKMADIISSRFVPAVMLVALFTFFLWIYFGGISFLAQGTLSSIAVLLIACPCALGLATPTAIMVGTGIAAKMGILFRNGEAIEKLRDINAVVLDKTGTLTEGSPTVLDHEYFEPESLLWIFKLSEISNHPLSMAVKKFISHQAIKTPSIINKEVDITFAESIPGSGVQAQSLEDFIFLGSVEWMKSLSVDLSTAELFMKKNARCSFVAAAKKTPNEIKLTALFALKDVIKSDAQFMITALNKKNIQIHLASGDRLEIVQDISNQLGISHFYGEMKPQDKFNLIKKLQSDGLKVAMLGDGVNDAPSLNLANLGVAMSTGTDIALSSSDVTLLKGELKLFIQSFEISRKTIRTIKENLFLSLAYNTLMIPLAAGLFYPTWGISLSPMWASLAMALSSVSVVLNSLRLKWMFPHLSLNKLRNKL